MARGNSHPYVPGPGVLLQSFDQFRKGLPSKIDATTLKKLSIAPNNEVFVISTLKFLGLIDENSSKTKKATSLFTKHKDEDFHSELQGILQEAYKELFDLRHDSAWTLDRDSLISFFRAHDETSALTAKRQAIAFETLSSLAGQTELGRKVRSPKSENQPKLKRTKKESASLNDETPKDENAINIPSRPKKKDRDFGLTVRIEINLPSQGDQETYDRIFKSIKRNLIDVE